MESILHVGRILDICILEFMKKLWSTILVNGRVAPWEGFGLG